MRPLRRKYTQGPRRQRAERMSAVAQPRHTQARRWRSVAIAAAGLASLLAAGWYSWQVEPRRLRQHLLELGIPGLPDALMGMRLAFLSDFHVGRHPLNATLTRAAIAAALDWDPDLILLGGDYFDGGRIIPTDVFDELARHPRVFAVLGNHDHIRGAAQARRIAYFLEERDVTVLQNEQQTVTIRDIPVTITGLDDPYSGHAWLDPAWLREEQPPLRVLLAHAPQALAELPPGFAHLALVGHTHGGQVRLSPTRRLSPLDLSWWLDRVRHRPLPTWERGLHWIDGTLAYVTNGIGTTWLPVRFLAPPELVCCVLVPAPVRSEAPCDQPARYVVVDVAAAVPLEANHAVGAHPRA